MAAEKKIVREKVTFKIDKERRFSEWFTEIIKTAELADIRYNLKGFAVFQPWSVLSMEGMYKSLDELLQRNSHKPYWYPVLIPEKNFYLESEHVKGFAPAVFWVTHAGDEKLEERLALRPTSETAFYQMFALWIRSHADLPFKTYQRAQVFRHETKATRPFLRSREFHWIETHCAFATADDAMKQVEEDMRMTKEFLEGFCAIPSYFFERPQWDKFAGAERSFAADSLMPDGRLIQLPATHFIGCNFSKKFGVSFTGKDGRERSPFTTCWGPAVSRIFAAMVSIHGDNNGLVFPFTAAPVQVVVVPIPHNSKTVLSAAKKIEKELRENGFRAEVDSREDTVGNKFYYWEMKGVPLRVELGQRELKKGKALVFRRDTAAKKEVALSKIAGFVGKTGKEINANLFARASKNLSKNTAEAGSVAEIKKLLEEGKIVKTGFCSIAGEGEPCAEVIEKQLQASIRGKRLDKGEAIPRECVVCGKKASALVYVARSY